MSIISLQALSKSYGQLLAVANLSLEVQEGEIFGFLGLNGSGKTTTIRILLDLLRPTSGRATMFGLDCQHQGLAVRARVGYLPGEMGLYRDMTGEATLDLFFRLGGGSGDHLMQQRLLDRLELSRADLRRKLREYSTGMKRKLGIVQAFQNDPELLILDEPTEGLDPLMQHAFYELLAETRTRGRTVFMSSHVLTEVQRVCDRVALIRQGNIIIQAPVAEIRQMAPRRVTVIFDADVPPPASSGNWTIETVAPRHWTILVKGPTGALTRALAALPVADLQIQEPSLEDALRQYYVVIK
jgi:ABC-2 type transport system ATP-binding protein